MMFKASETAMTYDEFQASEEKPEKKKKTTKRKRSPSPPPKVSLIGWEKTKIRARDLSRTQPRS